MFLIFLISLGHATSYLPNGSTDPAPYIAQCPSKYDTHNCCWLNGLSSPDDCTTQGIRLSSRNQESAQYNIDSCTDPDWGSGCSPLRKLCPSNSVGYVEVTTCTDGSVCCGQFISTCCSDKQGYRMNAKGQLEGNQPVPTTLRASSHPSASGSSATSHGNGSKNLSKKQQILLIEVLRPVAAAILLTFSA